MESLIGGMVPSKANVSTLQPEGDLGNCICHLRFSIWYFKKVCVNASSSRISLMSQIYVLGSCAPLQSSSRSTISAASTILFKNRNSPFLRHQWREYRQWRSSDI